MKLKDSDRAIWFHRAQRVDYGIKELNRGNPKSLPGTNYDRILSLTTNGVKQCEALFYR